MKMFDGADQQQLRQNLPHESVLTIMLQITSTLDGAVLEALRANVYANRICIIFDVITTGHWTSLLGVLSTAKLTEILLPHYLPSRSAQNCWLRHDAIVSVVSKG